ncbi:arylsulfatase [Devriesea agamarum]|uniref:arylsulfatase n=1 Tax=Devriesea agamarum TaxID=472569 RepID=UPI000A97DFA7|nr:arylsulfatase [Devriesea agamarum]
MHHTSKERPNIVLICVDQMRADAISALGHPVVRTPWLDALAQSGVVFEHAYSATPTCVPARVGLLTGQSQERHGRYGYREQVPFPDAHPVTMPGVLREHGYQTQAIGKMHVFPERSRCGFDDVRLHDGFLHVGRRYGHRHLTAHDDYLTWLRAQPGMAGVDINDDGVGCNSLVARPFDKPEAYHPTTWAVTEAINWLDRRDVSCPFFLYLSFHRPHAPFDPPGWALDQYLGSPLPKPPIGQWVHDLAGFRTDHDAEAQFGRQHEDVHRRAVAGYYGNITHIDHQIGRFLEALGDHQLAEDTVILFVSDHGDMMGDHYMYRKSVGYEGSARVPLIMSVPPRWQPRLAQGNHVQPGLRCREVVELRDIMPTVLDLARAEIPESVDGRSLLPLVTGGDAPPWREDLHGEHVIDHFGCRESMHWIRTRRHKFCWFSGSGREQLFDLDSDPQELNDLVTAPRDDTDHTVRDDLRCRLIVALEGREEGFVQNGRLIPGRPVITESSRVREVMESSSLMRWAQ